MTYIKTESGQQAFKDRAPALIKLRAAFILIDGKRTVNEVLRATAGMGIGEPEIAQLLALGYIAEDAASEPTSEATTPQTPVPQTNPNELYLRGYAIATQLTAGLGLRGFRLNLAVESASGYQQLVELLPKIREVVGADKCRPLEEALGL
nr:hypothetical protein [uncultured Albidiferax sp.]